MAINLNKGVNVHKIGDANDVLSTSTPNDVNSQGILKESGASGVFVISNADLEVWFHYDDGNGTLQWVLHNTLSKADIGYQDGHAVAWRNHKDHGTVTAMYLKAIGTGANGEDPEARTLSISKVIIADADIKDSELKKDFLNWYSNPVAEDLPGVNAATQAVNYDGYERRYHDLSNHSIGEDYSFTVPGYVDSAVTFTRMVDKIPCSYVYDDKNDETTITFEIIDGEYGDYHTTLDIWHTWWSLGEPPLAPFKMTIEVPEATGLGVQLFPNVSTALMTYITMNQNQVGSSFRIISAGIDLGNVGDQLIFVSADGHGTIYATMTVENRDETTFVIDSMEITPSQFPTFESQFVVYALPTVSFDFPLVMKSGETFDFAVNWGDGTEESLTNSSFSTYAHGFSGSQLIAADGNAMTYNGYDTDVLTYSHTYTTSGSHQITITGDNIPLRYGHALEMTPADMVTRTSYDDFTTAQTSHSDPAPRAKAYIRSVDQWGSATFNDLNAAFERCINFDVLALDIPKFGTDADLGRMFKLCAKLDDANGSIEKWDTSNVKNMMQLFAGVRNFKANIDTKLVVNPGGGEYLAWNVGNVENFSHMFVGLVNMNLRAGFNQPIPNWDMNNANNLAGMFAYCNFNQDLLVKGMRSNTTAGASITQNVQVYDDNYVYFNGTNNTIETDSGGIGANIELDGSNGVAELLGEVGTTVILVSNKGNIKATIAATGNVIELAIRSYDISVSTNEEEEFFNVHTPEFGSAPDWTAWYFGRSLPSGHTASFVKMFYNNIVFNSDISNWYMFTSEQGKIWVNEMFSYARNFNQPLPRAMGDTDDGPYMSWDLSRASGASRMFKSAAKFNQDIGDMFANGSICGDYTYMFHNATDYNNAGQSLDWDTSAAIQMSSMFENASSFNINISNWDVSNVTHFNNMFEDAVAFNQDFGQGPAGSGPNCWDTSSGTRFDNMFQQCTSFNQPLYFDVRSAHSMSHFLDGATLYSMPLGITFGNGGNYVAGESIGPQNLGKDPAAGKYLSMFMRNTNYGTAQVDALLVKLVSELQNLNTVTHTGHGYHNASDGNQYEGLLESLPAHTANSPAATARFGLIQNGWWVEDNTIVTPVPNNESFDIQGWANDFEFPESTLINAQIGGTFTLVDNDGNFSGTDFTLEYTDLTNINGDSKDMSKFELISQYGGTAFAIKLKKGHVYTYDSSWDDYYIIHFKISTPNGSFRNVTRKIRLTNVKPDGVNMLNMIDLGHPARNTNLLTNTPTTTLTYTGAWNTTPYGILKPKWPGSGAGIYGTYGGQYLGAAITVEGMPNYKDDFVTQLGLGNGAFDPTNLPPTWPNVVAGPYIHIKRSRFNSENDYEQFNTASNPYKMYIADITEWVNGAADQDGIDIREGVEVELVGVDMDLGWWVQEGPSGSSNGGATTANYFCEFRSSPLPPQARREIQGSPEDNGLLGAFDPSFDGFSNRKYGEHHPSDAHHGSDFSGTWHNINKRGWKNVTNKFEILKNYHTNPITGENQDHWEITYSGEDIDSFPISKHFPDNFQQTQSENDFWSHPSFSSSNHPQNSYGFYVPRIYQTEFGDTVTGNYWRKGVQFTIWYRFRDASNSTLMFGSDHGVGNETDDNGLYSGTLKKICLVVRTSLK